MTVDVYEKPEVVEHMRDTYNTATTDEARRAVVEALAMELGKSESSVIGKLVAEGIYQKPERKTKSGKPVVSKAKYAADINVIMGIRGHELSENEEDTLTKVNKTVLEKVLAVLEGYEDELYAQVEESDEEVPEPESEGVEEVEVA